MEAHARRADLRSIGPRSPHPPFFLSSISECIVKTRPYVAVCLSAWCALGLSNAAHAQEDLETRFAQFQQQFEKLSQRVDRLERENVALRAENEQLKGRADAGVASAESTKAAPAADWPSRISLRGDLRYRHQQTDDGRLTAERDEHLLRARTVIDGKVSDTVTAGIGFATSEAGNPRGANVRLDGEFSRKPLFIDLGYIDWAFAPGAHAILGKMRVPFVRPGQSLFWDNDLNPEGVALTYSRDSMFGTGYGFWVDENVQVNVAAPTITDTTDTKLYGLQIGNRFALGDSSLMVGASYSDLAAGQGRRPFFAGIANGNSLDPSGGLAYDFRVLGLMTEYNTRVIGLPLQLWVDVAQNQDSVLDTAIGAGAMLGKATDRGAWEIGLAYELIEKDALFAQLIDSDFAGGFSDAAGWIVRAGYAS
jgi:Putative porin